MLISDKLFINGKNVANVEHILQNGRFSKPITNIDKNYILSKIGKNETKIRHYKVIYIPIWNNQLIFNIYYRFIIMHNSLFVEVKFFLLPPLKEK